MCITWWAAFASYDKCFISDTYFCENARAILYMNIKNYKLIYTKNRLFSK